MFETVDPYDGEWDSFVPTPPAGDDADADDGCLDPTLEVLAAQAMDAFERACEADRVDELDADGTLSEVAASRLRVNLALVEQLVLATHWADLHGVLDPAMTGPGAERLVRLGGDGNPEIAEFAPVEFAVMLRVGDTTAARLIADALDLRHRFPLLWAQVQTGAVDVWMARKTVEQARGLSQQAAAMVDRRVAHLAGTLSWSRLRKVVDKAILEADPPQALDDAKRAAEEAGAWLNDKTEHGYGSMFIKARAGDLVALTKALDVIARATKILGDPGTLNQRRAAAAGIIANPKAAQELIDLAERVRTLQIEAAAARRAGDPAAAERIEHTIADLMPTEPTLPDPTLPDPTT